MFSGKIKRVVAVMLALALMAVLAGCGGFDVAMVGYVAPSDGEHFKIAVTVGDFAKDERYGYAIKNDGSLWQIYVDDSENNSEYTVTTTKKILDDCISVTSNGVVVFALKRDGTLWSWQSSISEDLEYSDEEYLPLYGDDASTLRTSPKQILTDVVSISINTNSPVAFAIRRDGSLWSWGDGTSVSILGQGSTSVSTSPKKILEGVKTVGSFDYAIVPTTLPREESHAKIVFAVKTDNTVWEWGHRDKFYRYEDGSGSGKGIFYSDVPVESTTSAQKYLTDFKDKNDQGISYSSTSGVYLDNDGDLHAFEDGDDYHREYIDGYYRGFDITVLTNVAYFTSGIRGSVLALKKDGTLWIDAAQVANLEDVFVQIMSDVAIPDPNANTSSD